MHGAGLVVRCVACKRMRGGVLPPIGYGVVEASDLDRRLQPVRVGALGDNPALVHAHLVR